MKSSFLALVQGSVHSQEVTPWDSSVDLYLCCTWEAALGEIPGNIKWLICPGCLCRMTDHRHLQFSLLNGHDFMTVSLNLLVCLRTEVLLFSEFFLKFDSEVAIGILSSTKNDPLQTFWIDSYHIARFHIKVLKNCKCFCMLGRFTAFPSWRTLIKF